MQTTTSTRNEVPVVLSEIYRALKVCNFSPNSVLQMVACGQKGVLKLAMSNLVDTRDPFDSLNRESLFHISKSSIYSKYNVQKAICRVDKLTRNKMLDDVSHSLVIFYIDGHDRTSDSHIVTLRKQKRPVFCIVIKSTEDVRVPELLLDYVNLFPYKGYVCTLQQFRESIEKFPFEGPMIYLNITSKLCFFPVFRQSISSIRNPIYALSDLNGITLVSDFLVLDNKRNSTCIVLADEIIHVSLQKTNTLPMSLDYDSPVLISNLFRQLLVAYGHHDTSVGMKRGFLDGIISQLKHA
jgi:hypothetical protein